MSAILSYAQVSTGDQDVAGQELRLCQAGAAKVFTKENIDTCLRRAS